MSSNAFSALIQLVGIRDLSDGNPGAYQRNLGQCIAVIEQVFSGHEYRDARVYFIVDQCFVEEKSLLSIIGALNLIRELLMEMGLFMRAVIAEGPLCFSKKRLRLGGSEKGREMWKLLFHTEMSCSLSARSESLKAVALAVDSSGSKKKFRTFLNYFVESFSSLHYAEFVDVRLRKEFATRKRFLKIIKYVISTKRLSRKKARFFVPLLRNWVEVINLNTEFARDLETEGRRDEDEGLNEEFNDDCIEDVLCSESVFSELREIVGIELVYMSLFRKAIQEENPLNGSPRHLKIINFLKSQKRLHGFIEDSCRVRFPEAVISRYERRRLAEILSDGRNAPG
jgi:hypothetical protein